MISLETFVKSILPWNMPVDDKRRTMQ